MRRATCSLAALFLAPALICGASKAATATKAKTKAAPSTASKKTSKSSSKTSNRSSRIRKSRTSARRKPARPSYQTHPTAARYKEIQQSLADKGYFKGEVNGTWGGDSTEALKRFQSDRKLPDDGKLNSLSLIQLGLGPKHTGTDVHPGAPPEATPPLPSVTEAPVDTPEPHYTGP